MAELTMQHKAKSFTIIVHAGYLSNEVEHLRLLNIFERITKQNRVPSPCSSGLAFGVYARTGFTMPGEIPTGAAGAHPVVLAKVRLATPIPTPAPRGRPAIGGRFC
jgi:hypothetical protein